MGWVVGGDAHTMVWSTTGPLLVTGEYRNFYDTTACLVYVSIGTAAFVIGLHGWRYICSQLEYVCR